MSQEPILSTIKELETPTIESLAEHYSVSEMAECENPLEPIITVFKILGPKIFDDEAQWHTYRHLIAAMALIDSHSEFDTSDTLLTDEYTEVGNQYNPLGEVKEADINDGEIAYLVGRYCADELTDLEDYPNTYTSSDPPRSEIQSLLAGAILNFTMGPPPDGKYIQKLILLSMFLVDKPFNTKSELEYKIETKTQTFGEGENKKEFEFESPTIYVRLPTEEL